LSIIIFINSFYRFIWKKWRLGCHSKCCDKLNKL